MKETSVITKLEDRLKKRIGSDLLIGCYTKDNGSARFTDIRGVEGEVVSLSDLKGHKIEIPYTDKILKENEFYTFHWHVEDEHSFRFAIDGQVKPIDKPEFLRRLFKVYAEKTGKDLEDSVSFQNTIFGEVTGAEHTYIYELLQNANDYPYEGERDEVAVKFILTEHYLLFLHSGAEFNLRNIVGICSINQGEKKGNTETIGYKGIGFKTVFVNNDFVYLRSGDWKMRFDKHFSEEKANGDCAWSLMPIPTEERELDEELQEALRTIPSNYRVQFALRHKSDAKQNIPQLEKVFSDKQILLFIPHVAKAEVYIGNERRFNVEKDKDEWIVTPFKFPVPDDLKVWVSKNMDGGSKIPEKFRDISNIGISFAVERNGNELIPVQNARIYNYLPTELRLGFNFLINADFVPNGSRSGLHDVVWNDVVMKECGRKFVDWWSGFFEEKGKWDMNSVFKLIPDFSSKNQYAGHFMDGFFERMTEVPCIPVEVNGEYRLCKISEIIYDKSGLMDGENPILTDEEFYAFTRTEKFLPHKIIRNNPSLQDLLEENFGDDYEIFDGNYLLNLCKNPAFNNWIKQRDNNIRFNSFLIETGFITILTNYPIFLAADGELSMMSNLYLNVDKYLGDIGFVADFLRRLDPQVRDALQQIPNWHGIADKFKHFSDYKFAQELIQRFAQIKDRLSDKQNNIGFLRFVANSKLSASNLPQLGFKVFSDKDEVVSINSTLFMSNDLGSLLMKQSWVDASWLNFVSRDYFDEENAAVIRAFMRTLNIRVLTPDIVFEEIIANDCNVTHIAAAIADKETNKAFYRFMAEYFFNAKYKYTRKMRDNFILFATNGKNELTATIASQIYFKNEEWEEAIKEPWMPSNICLALSSTYSDDMDEDSAASLKSYMMSASLASSFTMKTMGILIKSERHISAICDYIQNQEDSKSFLNFLYYNRDKFFSQEENIGPNFQKIPILWEGQEQMLPCVDTQHRAYFHTRELDNLCQQVWYDASNVFICDHYYDDLFDGIDRRRFFNRLGIKAFELDGYFRRHILAVLDRYRQILSDRSANLAFHRFLYSIHKSLTKDDYDKLKEIPIFIESSDNEEGELVSSSNGHYMPSAFLTEIIKLDIVPIDILDTVHHDYIHNEGERQYFKEYLDNVDITESNFISYIIECEENVSEYLEDKERNIRFWRWVCDAKLPLNEKSKLRIFPMLGYDAESGEDDFLLPQQLFISEAYSDINNVEEFISEFTEEPYFVSSLYKQEDDKRNWIFLFKTLNVTTETDDIVFNHLLPALCKYERTDIVSLLADHERKISKALKDESNPKIKENIAKLRLLCDDGVYRYPKDALLSGAYFELFENPFPEIVLGDLISESYIDEATQSNDSIQRIKRLLVAVADSCGKQCNTLTALRKEKIRYYFNHQDLYGFEDHLNIIAQLADCYDEDPDGIRESCRGIRINLYDIHNHIYPSNELYLSSCYIPDCDFMGYGIETLHYLNEAYADKISIDVRRNFFRLLRLKDSFASYHIELLQNSTFARYFWGNYAQHHQEQLSQICTADTLQMVYCIPSPLGIKRPCDLYDYREPQLQKIVLALANGEEKLPNINLPTWVGAIGLRGRLSVPDCLEYLKLDTNDYRRGIINWIIDSKDETLHRYHKEIREYIETANWFNGKKEWVPLQTLVALEWNNETLKSNFSNNAYVCNPSYMPEYKQDFERLCNIFNIKILKNSDFEKRKAGQWFEDTEAKQEIQKRLLYLAYKSGKEHWTELYDEYVVKLQTCEICSCKQIDYFYNEHIITDLMSFIEEDDKLWYVGQWNGMMFLDLLKWTIRVFEIKGLQESFLAKLFATDFKITLRTKEHDLPQEFLDYLDESTREGLKVEEEEQIVELIEVKDASATLDESLVNNILPSSFSLAQPVINDSHYLSEEKNKEEEYKKYGDNREEADKGVEDNISNDDPIHRERKERSDKGKLRDSRSHKDTSQEVSQAYEECGKNLRSRLQEKWNKKVNKDIHRPLTRPFANEEICSVGLNNSSEPSDFFENGNYSSRGGDPAMRMRQNLRRKNTEARDAAEQAEDQLQINELLDRTPRYTFLWFKYLMELMFADRGKFGIRTMKVDFYGKHIICDGKVLRLSDPSQVIPTWVENVDNLQLMAYKNGNSEVVKASVINVTDVVVDFLLDEDHSQLGVCRTASMFRLKAENSSNIIDALSSRFHQLPYEDEFNLKDNLPKNISFIYGPPGTGKTTRLVDKLNNIIVSAEEKTNILVLTPTNKAADVIAKRLANDAECYSYLSRYGSTNDTSLIEEEAIVTTRDTMNMDLYDHNIVVTTVARYPYDTVKPNDDFICDYPWDYIVIDEASMINIVEITYILHKGQGSKFIIAGDPKQIQPVKQGNIEVENIYQMIGINELKNAINNFERYPLEALTMQYRSVPVIGDLVSQFAYNNLVTPYSLRNEQKPLKMDDLNIRTINFLGFEVREFDQLYGLGAIGGSAFHLYSVIFTYNMVRYTAEMIAKNHPDQKYSIGVVCPYHAEADAIKQMFEERPVVEDNTTVNCGTVHSFQGDECDIMFVVLNPPSRSSSGTHVNNQNIINVAISRARDYLFFVVPEGQIDGYGVKNRLGDIIDDQNRSIFHCANLEKNIFGKEKYIEENTMVTCHLPVNVYYESSAEYEVRWDDSALDIQIHDL